MRAARNCLIAFGVLTWTSIAASQGQRLSIERLYSQPSIIGTQPKDFVWSSDSQRVAFLWNDEGTNFYDAWIADVSTGKPVRVTSMPRLTKPVRPGTDIVALQQVARAELETGVSAVAWRYGGRELLVLCKGNLYAVKPGRAPVQLVQGTDVSDVKGSSASDQVAFISAGDLWMMNLNQSSGRPVRVTSIARQDVSVENFYWSPDGRRVAFVETDQSQMPSRGIPDYLTEETKLVSVKRPFPGEPSEHRRLGIAPVESGAKIQWVDLGPNSLDLIFEIAWSPDSKTLLVDKSDLYIKHRRMMLVEAQSGSTSLLLQEDDPKNVTAEWWADWAPDGRSVYFLSDRENDYHVYYQGLKGGAPKRITSGDWAVFSAAVSPTEKAIFFTANKGQREERQLFKVSLNGGAPELLTHSAGTHTAVISPDGRFAADHFSNDLTPPDLYLTQLGKSNEAQQITHSPLPEFRSYGWVGAQYVTFQNVHDGTALHARLTLPAGFDKTNKYPAILGSVYSNTVHNQWGGRVAHPTWGLDQYLAQQGYVLLNVDISGSSGYGKSFRQRIGMDYGGVDVEDLFSGAEYLKSLSYVDDARIGIWGSSYGGLLTTTSLFTHPGTYKAGVAGAPATSLFHALTGEMRTMMAPQDHQAQYARSSAFFKSGGLQDHLLLIHGMRDQVVLFKDSVTLLQRLILQEKDAQLLVLPDAPHSWDTGPLAQTRYAYRQLVAYFKSYLGEGPTAASGAASAARQAGTPSR